jgi:hypothetical protein
MGMYNVSFIKRYFINVIILSVYKLKKFILMRSILIEKLNRKEDIFEISAFTHKSVENIDNMIIK